MQAKLILVVLQASRRPPPHYCGVAGKPSDKGVVAVSAKQVESTNRAGTPAAARRVGLRLIEAMGRGDLDAADALVAALLDPSTGMLAEGAFPGVQSLLDPVGMLHLARGRYREAAAVLAQVTHPEPRTTVLLRYARNMQALEMHRPQVFRVVADAPALRHYEIDDSGPIPTVIRLDPAGRGGRAQPIPVIAGGDAAAHLQRTWAEQVQAASKSPPTTLLGIGDGHLLRKLTDHPPRTVLGIEQSVVIVESDVDLVRACLMLHDLTGTIEQARFQWCVGERWADLLRAALNANTMLALPSRVVCVSAETEAAATQYQELVAELREIDARDRDAIQRYYAKLTADDFIRALSGRADRPPRALLLTSRFTTVLQYSTRDAARALEAHGWQTRVLIEDAPHHQMTGRHVRQAMLDFKPDLVFMIDHLRHEAGDLFPPQVPFVCWIQDNLPNLTSHAAGASIGPRDFILTCAAATYAGQYGYPLRQCIYLDKLARKPSRPEVASLHRGEGDDLVFVSNASGEPAKVAEKVIDRAAGHGDLQRLLRVCAGEMLATYERGDHIHSYSQVRDLLVTAAQSLGQPPLADVQREQWVYELFDRLNNALYRQQALTWAAEAAEARGLTLALYGQGWDRHPRFARYARGTIAYGEPLETVTRRARINLQIVPFSIMHQRLLDGLLAGGFFLIREHPVDALAIELAQLPRTLPAEVQNTADARRILQGQARMTFDDLVHRFDTLFNHTGADIVEVSRMLVDQGATFRLTGVPRREAVCFGDPESLSARLDHYLDDRDARQAVWQQQCAYVERHMTYTGDLPRVLKLMVNLLGERASDRWSWEPGPRQ